MSSTCCFPDDFFVFTCTHDKTLSFLARLNGQRTYCAGQKNPNSSRKMRMTTRNCFVAFGKNCGGGTSCCAKKETQYTSKVFFRSNTLIHNIPTLVLAMLDFDLSHNTHTHTHTRTHAHTHTRTYAHTHIQHTYTHIQHTHSFLPTFIVSTSVSTTGVTLTC